MVSLYDIIWRNIKEREDHVHMSHMRVPMLCVLIQACSLVVVLQSSGDPVTEAQGRALRLVLSVDQLLSAQRRQRTTTAGEEARQGGSEGEGGLSD